MKIFILHLLLMASSKALLNKLKLKPTFLFRKHALSAIKLLIQGTKNAYTNLQTWDCVLYQVPETDGQSKTLGYLTQNNTIQQLCVWNEGDAEFHPDLSVVPISAQKLVDQKRLLRMISSDRSKGVFFIDEYLDSDIYIPVRAVSPDSDQISLTKAIDTPPSVIVTTNISAPSVPHSEALSSAYTNNNNNNNSNNNSNSNNNNNNNYSNNSNNIEKVDENSYDDIEIVQAQLKVAKLELKLLQMQMQKRSNQYLLCRDQAINPNNLSQQQPQQVVIKPSPSTSSTSSLSSLSSSNMTPALTLGNEALQPVFSACAKVTLTQGMVYISGCTGVDVETFNLSKKGIEYDFMKSITSTATFESEVCEALKNLKLILQNSVIYNKPIINGKPVEFSDCIYRLCSVTIILNDIEKAGVVKRIFTGMFTPTIDLVENATEEKLKLPVLRFLSSPVKLAFDAEIEIDAIATV